MNKHIFNRRVRRFMRNAILRRCIQPLDDFRSEGAVVETKDGPLIWVDRGSEILAVGHLDFVKWWDAPFISKNKEYIQCPQLDDRLGVAIILDILPELGVNCDVLLTDSEEIGRSTASSFDPPKDYKWIFEFDRACLDVVMYDYETEAATELLEDFGWEVGMGSFTDICSLEHLGVQGFNFGCGYQDQHTNNCLAFFSDVAWNLERFLPFYKAHKDTTFPWDETQKPKTWWNKGSSWYRRYDDDFSPSHLPLGTPRGSTTITDEDEEADEVGEYLLQYDEGTGQSYYTPYGYPDRWECPECFGQSFHQLCSYCGYDPVYERL